MLAYTADHRTRTSAASQIRGNKTMTKATHNFSNVASLALAVLPLFLIIAAAHTGLVSL